MGIVLSISITTPNYQMGEKMKVLNGVNDSSSLVITRISMKNGLIEEYIIPHITLIKRGSDRISFQSKYKAIKTSLFSQLILRNPNYTSLSELFSSKKVIAINNEHIFRLRREDLNKFNPDVCIITCY